MDKSWMSKKKWTVDYAVGVKSFLEFASRSSNSQGKIYCPCKVCINRYFHYLHDVEDHLLRKGVCTGYYVWTKHGEERGSTSVAPTSHGDPTEPSTSLGDQDEEENAPNLEDLLRDTFEIRSDPQIPNSENTEQETAEGSVDEQYTKLFEDLNTELYPGCKTFSKLSFVLELYRLKCLNSWTITSFDMLLELISSAFPEGSTIPKNTYHVKKLLKAFDLGYEKIHACPNDCQLYWGDKAEQENCQNCGVSRWDPNQKKSVTAGKKKSMKPAKIMRYFPLIPRLQRLFKHKKTAEEMVWHESSRKKDGIIRHPADGEAWKSFDLQYPDFASDARNVRLGLSSDGFNPNKVMSSTYSIWPVVLVQYNMPPWIGLKKESFILSTIIPGEKCPGQDIDIYLQPLIKELQDLWIGVPTFDAAKGENFIMRATLLWTINDFPAYGMLSGWSTKGRLACPCCADRTDSLWLYKSQKFAYMGHRQWLEGDHQYRRQKSQFNNQQDFRCPPGRSTGSEILERLRNQIFISGVDSRTRAEKRKRKGVERSNIGNWKKQSIFFQLPYWEFNKLPHNLDVMHIEKNVSDNFICILLDLDKSKDGLKARLDLVKIGIRSELHPLRDDSGAYSLPPTYFTMSKAQKQMFCQVLKDVKFPKMYASNFSRCVNITDCKISGMKSHDHHVLIEDILPIALSSCYPSVEILTIVSDLSKFLKSLCSTAINPDDLDKMQEDISLTLCQMEKYFLPSFFTVMIHLLVHLVEEVKLGGPVQYRWMYPFERFFSVLKNYNGNKAQPEGSIAEGYIAEEGINFCSKYFNVKIESSKKELIQYNFETEGTILGKIIGIQLDEKAIVQIHRYVLHHCDNVEPFKKQFCTIEKRKRRGTTHLTSGDLEKLVAEHFQS